MRDVVVGVDAGGTKTAVLVEDLRDGTRTEVVVPSTGWDAEPAAAAATWLDRAVRAALADGDRVISLVVGAQGLDAPEVATALEDALRALGYPQVRAVNDAELVVPAAGLGSGIALIAGTGAIGVGADDAGRTLATGGWGWVIGDEAGAAGIVREATRAALLAHDDGDGDDGLLGALLAAFAVTTAERLARAVNDEPTMASWGPRAPAVFAAADEGSSLARAVIDGAADHLVRLVQQLRRRGAVGLDVVAAGGVIARQPRLLESLRTGLDAHEPDLRLHLLMEPPVVGALTMARTARPR